MNTIYQKILSLANAKTGLVINILFHLGFMALMISAAIRHIEGRHEVKATIAMLMAMLSVFNIYTAIVKFRKSKKDYNPIK